MSKRGQALIEFILILPVFLAIVFVIIDFGMIINAKSSLENKSNDIIDMINSDKSIDEITTILNKNRKDKITITMTTDTKYKYIVIKSSIDIMTPGLNIVLDDPYPIIVDRIVPNE